MTISWQLMAIIALGGAIGSAARYGFVILFGRIMEHVHVRFANMIFGLEWVPEAAPRFPWGVMGVNIIGSFIMGVLVSLFATRWPISAEYRALLTTGFLGGFTTFSSFSLDAMILLERNSLLSAASYVILSVSLSLAAIMFGQFIVTGRA
ncbi:MAG: CrcB family protein [Alphaproteobacteria bacterium]|nr:CrcB family protein [Alphaproteobacteria bacterium]